MYKVCSIFSQVLKLFSRGGSPVGASSWPCCFASWDGRIRGARFAAVWRAAKGSCSIWGCRWRPKAYQELNLAPPAAPALSSSVSPLIRTAVLNYEVFCRPFRVQCS